MENVIITLWVLGAWAETASMAHAYGSNDFDWQDTVLILIWPITSTIVSVLIFHNAIVSSIKSRNPYL